MKEIPLEQKKGIYKRCKKCNGYGYLYKRVEKYWTIWKLSSGDFQMTMITCNECNGTGKHDWIERITKGVG